jgi:hypothetical protein
MLEAVTRSVGLGENFGLLLCEAAVVADGSNEVRPTRCVLGRAKRSDARIEPGAVVTPSLQPLDDHWCRTQPTVGATPALPPVRMVG